MDSKSMLYLTIFFATILTPTFGIGDAGNITVNTDILKLTDGSQIATNTRGQGNAGEITFNATDIELIGFGFIAPGNARPSGLFAQVLPNATGEAGNITITTKTLKLMDTATISNDTFGIGNAGDLTIVAQEIELTGSTTENGFSTAIASASNRGATGNAGNINIETNSLLIFDGAGVSALSFGDGKSGNINISANDIKLVGISDDGEVPSALITQVTSSIGSDNESNLIVKTNRLKIADGAQISASTFGDGQAGNIKIKASEIEVIGATPDGKNSSGIRSQVNPSATGTAGKIEIFTDYLKITDGAKISVSTFGEGNAGDLTLNANQVELIGRDKGDNSVSGLFSESIGTGDGGNLTINTEQLSILDGARISASSQETGLAGNLRINANSLILDNSAITTETDTGDGGNIILSINNLLLLRNNSQISTTAGKIEAGGDGGNITINSKFIIAVPTENSDITANAFNGNGGNINITTEGIFGIEFRAEQTTLSDITASSEFGIDGEVSINLLNLNPELSFVSLPRNFATPSFDTSCQASNGENSSSFVNLGKGGLPENPREIRSNQEIWDDLRSPNPDNSPSPNLPPQSTEYQPIIEAQGIVIGEKGEIILVANIEQKDNLENYNSPKFTNSCEDNN